MYWFMVLGVNDIIGVLCCIAVDGLFFKELFLFIRSHHIPNPRESQEVCIYKDTEMLRNNTPQKKEKKKKRKYIKKKKKKKKKYPP